MEQVSDLSLFNELFTIYKGRFVRFAQTFTRDATIAEDIVIVSHDQQCSYMNGVSDFGHSIFVVRCYKTVK